LHIVAIISILESDPTK